MVFRNRQHAGRLLAQKLKSRHIKPDIVFGLARGGVVVAAEIAAAFKVPLDVLVVRKISPPGNPEFAIGAIAAGTAVWWDENVVHRLGLSPQWQKQQINDKKIEISEYLANISIPKKTTLSRMKFRNIVLADDGAATGATMMAAIPAALTLGPGSETRGPMAIAIIGGLIVSTGLSLLVVPSFYLVMDRWKGHLVGEGKYSLRGWMKRYRFLGK